MIPMNLSDSYFVAPQISPDDLPRIAELGFGTLICNRPDAEVATEADGALTSASIGEAARALGLNFVYNPVTPNALTQDNLELQSRAIAEAGMKPVLAYCRTGNRSTILWALVHAGRLHTDHIIARSAAAGFRLEGLRPQLEAMASG